MPMKTVVKSQALSIEATELMAQDLAGNDLSQYIENRKHGEASGIDELKRQICDKIWKELSDDQVRDVDKYLKAY